MKKIPPLGPAPTPPREEPPVQALDPSRRLLLQVLSGRPVTSLATVGELVEAVGGHPNTTRHHLRVLVAAGLVREVQVAPSGGRGRPATRYGVTPVGRGAVAGDDASPGGGAAQEYVALAAAFAGRLAEGDGDPGEDARAIGKAWGTGLAARQAADVGDDLAGEGLVVDLLDRLGFSPDSVPGPHSAGTTVLLRTCPLLDAARLHPDVVCQVHLGLVAGALEAHHESSDGLRLEPFARPGACELALPPTLGR